MWVRTARHRSMIEAGAEARPTKTFHDSWLGHRPMNDSFE